MLSTFPYFKNFLAIILRFGLSFTIAVVSFGGVQVPYIFFFNCLYLGHFYLNQSSIQFEFSIPALFFTGDCDPCSPSQWPMRYESFSSCTSTNQKNCIWFSYPLCMMFYLFFSVLTSADCGQWQYHLCSGV